MVSHHNPCNQTNRIVPECPRNATKTFKNLLFQCEIRTILSLVNPNSAKILDNPLIPINIKLLLK